MEYDESHIYNAAQLMVVSLAGSLVHVTCKEPLRGAITDQFRNSFQGLNIGTELLEQVVPLLTRDNLVLGCVVIENVATEKALQTVDVEITQQFSLRMKHREGISPYYDALHPRPGHLSHSQQRVYEDFVWFLWQNQFGQSSNAVLVGSHAASGGSDSSGLSHAYASSSRQLNPGFYSTRTGATGLSATQLFDLIIEDMDPSSAQFVNGPSTRTGVMDGVDRRSTRK